MFVPVLIFITGIALPLATAGTVTSLSPPSYERIQTLASSWPVQVFLFVVISLSLFHWAHRFRYTLIDLGVHGGRNLVAALCYGSAIVGTGVAVRVIWT